MSEYADPGKRSAADFVDGEEAALEAALRVAPRGAFALAGLALVLLMIGWLLIYVFVFLPRGPVG